MTMLCVMSFFGCSAIAPSVLRHEVTLEPSAPLEQALTDKGLDDLDAVVQIFHAGTSAIFSDYVAHGPARMFEPPPKAVQDRCLTLAPGAATIINGHTCIGLFADPKAFVVLDYKGMTLALHSNRMATGNIVEQVDEFGAPHAVPDVAVYRPGSAVYLDLKGRTLAFTEQQLAEVIEARQRGVDFSVIPQANPLVRLRTTKGDIVVELFEDETPNTVAAFLEGIHSGLWKENASFYRVCPYSPEFDGVELRIAQGGIPGMGAKRRIAIEQTLREHSPGTLAMLTHDGLADPVHVFVNLDPMTIESWKGVYPVFGRVYSETSAFDLNALRQGEVVARTDESIQTLDALRPGDAIKGVTVLRQRRLTYTPTFVDR